MELKKPHLRLDKLLLSGYDSTFNVLPADTSAQAVGELILGWMSGRRGR